MATGANNTPLGRLNPALAKSNSKALKRQIDDDDSSLSPKPSDSNLTRRKRRSRWDNNEEVKTFIPGMPTVLPCTLSKEQEKIYLLQLKIEEVSRRLRIGDLGISENPEERSPSPEPIYNNEGKRLNTREYYTRKKMEDERHQLITKMYQLNPNFKPPADYKPPIIKVSDKVMIPQDTDINFIGLILGPRGADLKAMEKDTGAKIIIRGKGSVKEGKLARNDGRPLPGEDEPLHAYITANNPESVKKAVDKVKSIITGDQEGLRRKQLRDLALINGTLRENDGQRCSNCGSGAHKSWQCPDKPNVTNSVICTNCGGAGHIAKDCAKKRNGVPVPGENAPEPSKIDEEYMSLMAELGEGPKPPTNGLRNMPGVGPSIVPPVPPRPLMAPKMEPPPPGLSPPPAEQHWPPPYGGVPPPMWLPPPGSMPWMPQSVDATWQQTPMNGVPPMPSGMPMWQQGFMGVPPPPVQYSLPATVPSTTQAGTPGVDLNAFAQAPPPPPPQS